MRTAVTNQQRKPLSPARIALVSAFCAVWILWIIQPPVIWDTVMSLWNGFLSLWNAVYGLVIGLFFACLAFIALWQLRQATRPANQTMLYEELANLDYTPDAPNKAPPWEPNQIRAGGYSFGFMIIADHLLPKLAQFGAWGRLSIVLFSASATILWERWIRHMRKKHEAMNPYA